MKTRNLRLIGSFDFDAPPAPELNEAGRRRVRAMAEPVRAWLEDASWDEYVAWCAARGICFGSAEWGELNRMLYEEPAAAAAREGHPWV